MYNIYEIIDYICEGHKIYDACIKFGCSKTFIMKKLREIRTPGSDGYNKILAEKLALAMTRNSLMGRKNGGTNGKKEAVISDEEAEELKTLKETKSLSYRDLEQITGIPYSTIRLAIERVKDASENEISRGR